MACGHERHHGGGHRGHHREDSCACSGRPCTCSGHSYFGPPFWTKEEKIAWLERHLEDLQEQVQAAQERIAALKGE
jgi:hypothetical protein